MQPAFRKLKTMSRTRTTTESPRETTEPKRRAIDPKEQQIIDQLDALFRDLRPATSLPPQNPIDQLRDNDTIRVLAEKLVISGGELVQKAKQILSGILKCEGVEKFSNVVRDIWPFLTNGIRQARDSVNVIGLVLRYANHDSATQRWDRMKADPSLESSLAILKPAATTTTTTDFDIMRVFLIILIGYWGDKAELPKLDEAIGPGKPGFGQMLSLFENSRKKGKPPPVKRVDNFSYKIENAEDAKNMEIVQKWLVSTYGDDKDVDRDALLEKIRSVLSSNMKISLVSKMYDGKSKAMVHVHVADCEGVSISMSVWNGAKK